eukprot:Nk52_evm6s245 gene=Nk52_evmTU6s245
MVKYLDQGRVEEVPLCVVKTVSGGEHEDGEGRRYMQLNESATGAEDGEISDFVGGRRRGEGGRGIVDAEEEDCEFSGEVDEREGLVRGGRIRGGDVVIEDGIDANGHHSGHGNRLARSRLLAKKDGIEEAEGGNSEQDYKVFVRESRIRSTLSCFAGVGIGAVIMLSVYVVTFVLSKLIYGGSFVSVPHGAVAADVEQCSVVGVDILKKGGSSVDSAIASMLCLGVINTFSSGIGGGGFMLIFAGSNTEVIDFREVAPKAAHRDMFANVTDGSVIGGLGIGVPGELKGFALAHKKHGVLPWETIFQPAIDIALNGFIVPNQLATVVKDMEKEIVGNPVLKSVYAPNGVLIQAGDTLRRPKLGKTLKLIALKGADEFYTGSIANLIVSEIQENGGVITKEDLKEYKPEVRTPVSTKYQGYTVLSAPAPASGGVLIDILNILEGYNFSPNDTKNATTYHRIIEAFKFAYAKRTSLGDPKFTDIEKLVKQMLDKKYGEQQRKKIEDGKTFPTDYYGPHYDVEPTPGTSHLSVLGPDNTAVAVTSTVNLIFGSQVMSNSTGILFNDQMDDFSLPHTTNFFGVEPSKANFIQAGKRPLSSCSPTVITKNGKVRMVVGASGGTRITTSTAMMILDVLSFGMPVDKAMRAPRIHHQLLPDSVYMEEDFPHDIVLELRKYGHKFITPMPRANVQGIWRDNSNFLNATSDMRKGGVAKLY